MNLVLYILIKCGQGGEGVKKFENFVDVINGWPLRSVRGTVFTEGREKEKFSSHNFEGKQTEIYV